MRLICTGCGTPFEPIPGKSKRSCPACGVWTDYRHLLGNGQPPKQETPTSKPAKNETQKPDKKPDANPTPDDLIFDEVMGWGTQEPSHKKELPQSNKKDVPSSDRPEPEKISIPKPRAVQPRKLIEDFKASDNPDDDLPYGVTGSTDILCPNCSKVLPENAVLCVHCGFNLETGDQVERVHKPLVLHWHEGMASSTRKGIAFLWSGAILAILVASMQMDDTPVSKAIAWILFAIPQVFFLVGSYGELTLTRNRKGQIRLERIFRVGFMRVSKVNLQPEGHEGIKCAIRSSLGFSEWVIFVFLLVPTLLPGIVFYFLVMHRPYVVVSLTKHTGRQESTLFRTRNEAMGREIAQTLMKLTGKPLDYAA